MGNYGDVRNPGPLGGNMSGYGDPRNPGPGPVGSGPMGNFPDVRNRGPMGHRPGFMNEMQQNYLHSQPVSMISCYLLSIDGIDKTRWSCPWNRDQNCTQNSARGGGGVQRWVDRGVVG